MNLITLPELGVGIENATVACWHKKIGDHVDNDDDLLEVVTDKATFNVPSNASGVLRAIFVTDGQQIKIGEKLGEITN